MHQLTDLPPGLDPSQIAEGTRRNARMRSEGTQSLVSATLASGAPRLITQSIAWMYAPGPQPHSEEEPLDTHAQGARAITVSGVATLERLMISSPPIEGIVLRYGHLYGPHTGSDVAGEAPALHVDAAASAALLAIEAPGRLQYRRTERLSLHRESATRTRIRPKLPNGWSSLRTAIAGRRSAYETTSETGMPATPTSDVKSALSEPSFRVRPDQAERRVQRLMQPSDLRALRGHSNIPKKVGVEASPTLAAAPRSAAQTHPNAEPDTPTKSEASLRRRKRKCRISDDGDRKHGDCSST
jgi:hypothetical protein